MEIELNAYLRGLLQYYIDFLIFIGNMEIAALIACLLVYIVPFVVIVRLINKYINRKCPNRKKDE